MVDHLGGAGRRIKGGTHFVLFRRKGKRRGPLRLKEQSSYPVVKRPVAAQTPRSRTDEFGKEGKFEEGAAWKQALAKEGTYHDEKFHRTEGESEKIEAEKNFRKRDDSLLRPAHRSRLSGRRRYEGGGEIPSKGRMGGGEESHLGGGKKRTVIARDRTRLLSNRRKGRRIEWRKKRKTVRR